MSDLSHNFEGLPSEFRIEELSPEQVKAISDLQIEAKKLDNREKQNEREHKLQIRVSSLIIGPFIAATLMFMISGFMGNKADSVQQSSQQVMNTMLPIVTMVASYCFGKNKFQERKNSIK